MPLKGRIQSDMKDAMKAGDRDRLRVVRSILAGIQQVEIDERRELDDAAVLRVVDKMVKQRRESATQFTDGGREDLARTEEAEIEVLKGYLPEPLSEAELDELIERAIADTGAATVRDMGKVMGAIRAQAGGRADMGEVGALVKSRLGR